MTMSQNRKYAGLPDLDSAPDIYETPLDGSTIAASTTGLSRSPSPSSSASSNSLHISRRHLQHPSEARTTFASRGTRRRGVIPDEDGIGVDEQRRAYRAGWKRLQRREAEANGNFQDIHGHDGDEGEDETLSEKLTRLRRETRDVLEQVERSRAGEDDEPEKSIQARKQQEEIRELCKLMEKARKDYEGLESNALAELEKVVDATKRPATSALNPKSLPPLPIASASHASTALTKAAKLESRLSTLESILGIPSHPPSSTALTYALPLPPQPSTSTWIQTPILQSLSTLETQLALLTSTPPTTLPHHFSSSPPHSLPQPQPQPQPGTKPPSPAEPSLPTTLTPEQHSQLSQLYATLPTIEALTPHLAHTLTRLRSLRYIHTSAAEQHIAVERLEKKATEVEAEIALWRGGLDRVEHAVDTGAQQVVANAQAVDSRVAALEARIRALSSAPIG